MDIVVGGFDVHRKQITFDYIEMESGEVHRTKIRPANRHSLRSWLEQFSEQFPEHEAAIAAVEATTGSGATSSRSSKGLESRASSGRAGGDQLFAGPQEAS